MLVGHSQGSWLLQTLIAQEIEGKPVAAQMALAIVPGFNVIVPTGKTVGGTFKSTPVCTRAGQRGCVVSYVSYRTNNPPPPGALFGYAPAAGQPSPAPIPAALGSRGWADLDSYWYTRATYAVPGGPIRWSTEGAPPTPYLRTEGLASGRCVKTASAAIWKSAPTSRRAPSGPTGSAAKSGLAACSSPAGACTLPTCRWRRATCCGWSKRSAARGSRPRPARLEPAAMTSSFDQPYRGGFVGPEHHFALTVYFEDTDTAGIVYYANYLKFMERARSDMLRAAEIDQRGTLEAGTGVYAVAEANVRYLRPAKLGDDLQIVSTVEEVRAASVRIQQRVIRDGRLWPKGGLPPLS